MAHILMKCISRIDTVLKISTFETNIFDYTDDGLRHAAKLAARSPYKLRPYVP